MDSNRNVEWREKWEEKDGKDGEREREEAYVSSIHFLYIPNKSFNLFIIKIYKQIQSNLFIKFYE